MPGIHSMMTQEHIPIAGCLSSLLILDFSSSRIENKGKTVGYSTKSDQEAETKCNDNSETLEHRGSDTEASWDLETTFGRSKSKKFVSGRPVSSCSGQTFLNRAGTK